METILLVAVVVLAVVVVLLFVRLSSTSSGQNAAEFLKQDITELNRSVGLLKDNLQATVSDRLDKNQALMVKQSSETNRIITEITRNLAELKSTN